LRGQLFRETYSNPAWRSLFKNLDSRNPVNISGQWAEEPGERALGIEAPFESNYVEPFGELPGEGGIATRSRDMVIPWLRLRYRYPDGQELTAEGWIDAVSG